jgi:hypothetical protein
MGIIAIISKTIVPKKKKFDNWEKPKTKLRNTTMEEVIPKTIRNSFQKGRAFMGFTDIETSEKRL